MHFVHFLGVFITEARTELDCDHLLESFTGFWLNEFIPETRNMYRYSLASFRYTYTGYRYIMDSRRRRIIFCWSVPNT